MIGEGIKMKFVFSILGETLVNVLDCKRDMGLWHGVLTVRLTTTLCTIYPDGMPFMTLVLHPVTLIMFLNLIFFLAECHEQNSHHHCAICCYESLSHVVGAKGSHSQRFSQISHLIFLLHICKDQLFLKNLVY